MQVWSFVADDKLPDWAQAAGPWLDLFGKVAPAVIAGAVLFVGQRMSEASDRLYERLQIIEKTVEMTCKQLEANTASDKDVRERLETLRDDVTRIKARLGVD